MGRVVERCQLFFKVAPGIQVEGVESRRISWGEMLYRVCDEVGD
jgi:hypothetical protein